MIGKIAVSAASFSLDKPYSYRIPADMELKPGHRVQLPFGRGNHPCEGIVLAVEPGDGEGLKSVTRCLDEKPLLCEWQLRLAAFMRERYFCTFYDAVRAMLPAGMWFRERAVFALTEDRSWQQAAIRKEGALLLLQELERLGGRGEEPALAGVIPDTEQRREVLAYLVRKKWVCTQIDLNQRIQDKTQRIATLAVSAEQAMAFAASRPRTAAMQRAVLELMCGVGSASVKDICYYTGASAETVKRLEKLGFLEFYHARVHRCRQLCAEAPAGPLVLNAAQQRCADGLLEQLEQQEPGVALLYGVTGSGKTQIYVRLIQSVLEQGKSAMLLVPEIALTPQLLSRMSGWFGDKIAVLHSSLPDGERCDQWQRIRDGSAKVVVGTRSAVFAPCVNLGLMILDEEQEHSYKSENSPRYHAREVAIWRGDREKALVLLGSATPSIESMYRARKGDYRLYTINERYNGQPLPEVEIVDMREELKMGNDLSLSYPLRQAVYDTHQAGKQTILLLNRRGNSRALVCVDCREAPECPRCSVRMTYHSANNRLMCHYCGHSQPVPQRCPACGGPLKAIGTGTQKVQQELEGLFPDMPVIRMDADTVSAGNTHEDILSRFRSEERAALVGTQMVAKGLDLPDVTLVGVLDGDLSLYTGGYRSGETTFDMLTQVVGRAGRGDARGRAVIQTMVPEHPVIRLAAEQDYDGFYDLEIQLRRVQQMPPFGDTAFITFSGEDEAVVLRGAVKFRDSLMACREQPAYAGERFTCLGPAACPVAKVNCRFRYRLTVNCSMTRTLRQLLAFMLREFGKDKINRGVTAYIDVNGFE